MSTTLNASGVTFPDGTTETTAGAISMASNGYVKLPSGLIIQWGVGTTNVAFSYPIAFPTGAYVLVGSDTSNPNVDNTICSSMTSTGGSFAHYNSNQTVRWIAIGH